MAKKWFHFWILRRYDGISNNKQHLMWGAVRENLRRRTASVYSDGVATPASVCAAEQRNNHTCAYSQEYSGYGSTRPSPRVISNELFQQTKSIISQRKINAFHLHFGQVSWIKKAISKMEQKRWSLQCRSRSVPVRGLVVGRNAPFAHAQHYMIWMRFLS